MGFDEFLKEAAPLFGLQWRRFRRKGIKRKVERRIGEIGASNFQNYLQRVRTDLEEQKHLSRTLTVTISRFFRDQKVFQTVGDIVLPGLLKEKEREDLRIWSIGCASGEEPFSLLLFWKWKFEKDWPKIRLSILATDIDQSLFERAKEGRYKKSSMREVFQEVLELFFRIQNDSYVLDRAIRESVELKKHDILREELFSGMDIIFCRNLAFTYFSKPTQIEVLKKIASSLKERGYLVIGKDEFLPLTYPTLFVPVFPIERIYQKF
jgi:chemotaxis methyl-accepting protein methylase